MKTNINNKSKKAYQFMFLLFTSFIMLAGCEKAELVQPTQSKAPDSNLKTVAPEPPAYIMLVIEHNALSSNLADYDVILHSDGSGTYRGWSNVARKGTIDFHADAATVSYIKNMFESANFFNIQQIPSQYDDPNVATTFSNRIQTKKLTDYDQGIPQILIQIRKKAEEKLNISQYVNSQKFTVPVSL